LVRYEYPFNESIRTMLRVEHLFDRLAQLMPREAAVDHHFALVTLFEIMDVASRADLKSDVLKELERCRISLMGYRGNPSISEQSLDAVIGRLDHAYEGLNQSSGKAGQALTANEWLMSIRSRVSIPGGTCEFDLPAYFAWQQEDGARRRGDLLNWTGSMMPLAEALSVLLSLVRDSGQPHKVAAPAGHFQQSLPSGRNYHLLRLRVDGNLGVVPEITVHRLLVSVRWMKQDQEGRLRPTQQDIAFELSLCG
jgi:cell division protein ZapD